MLLYLVVVVSHFIVSTQAVKCRQCFDAADPRRCLQIDECGVDEICYTKLFRNKDGFQRYHMGCEDKQICTYLNQAPMVGRRNAGSSPTRCHKCCSSESCNSQLCTDTLPKFNNMGSYRWRDCGGSNAWVTVQNFTLSPSPLQLPGTVTLSGEAMVSHPVTAGNFTADLLLEKEEQGVYREIPCNIDVGTCHHPDPCHILDFFAGLESWMPTLPFHVFGTCPFSQGQITLHPTSTTFNTINDGWKFLSTGTYHVMLTIRDTAANQMQGCLEVYLDLNMVNSTSH